MSKQAKQVKLDSYPSETQTKPSPEKKQIVITDFDSTLVWDDLILEVGFKLTPSKLVFSKVNVDLWFNQKRTKSFLFDILHSFDSTNEFELKVTLSLRGLQSGTFPVKVEMYEVMSSREKRGYTEKEIEVEYTSQTKKAKLREIPIVKKVEGDGIAIVSDSEKLLYKEMQETMKKELASKREQ